MDGLLFLTSKRVYF
jgi:hypothetical protein